MNPFISSYHILYREVVKIGNICRFSQVCTDLDAKIITVEVLRTVFLEKPVCPAKDLKLRIVFVDAGFTKRLHGETIFTFQLIPVVLGA
jgi:hypothetical protein